jgi:hypothetical protein
LLCISFFLCCMFHRSSGRVSAADASVGIIAYYYEHSSFSRFFSPCLWGILNFCRLLKKPKLSCIFRSFCHRHV